MSALALTRLGVLAEPQVVDEGDGADYCDSTDVDSYGALEGSPAASFPMDATNREDATDGPRRPRHHAISGRATARKALDDVNRGVVKLVWRVLQNRIDAATRRHPPKILWLNVECDCKSSDFFRIQSMLLVLPTPDSLAFDVEPPRQCLDRKSAVLSPLGDVQMRASSGSYARYHSGTVMATMT